MDSRVRPLQAAPPHADTGLVVGEDPIRYGRHLALPELGREGQQRLRAARILIVGMGGLGTPAAQYLAAAGVGTIGIVDGDRVELSNLQRQVLYGDADVGQPKVTVAAARLRRMNHAVFVKEFPIRLNSGNAMDVLDGYDVILDGTDNFASRYLINDAAWLRGIPVVHGSVLRFEGRVSVFGAPGPCYRCLFPEPPAPGVVPDCSVAGVLGAMAGLVGVLQAMETIKLVCHTGESLMGRLLLVDSLGPRFQTVTVQRNPACPLCGTGEIRQLVDYEAWCGGPPIADPFARLTPAELTTRLGPDVQVVDVREPWEWAICRLEGATLIPLASLDEQSTLLDPTRETIVYCHQGVRSLTAARQLAAAGFTRLAHLEGGIDRWSVEIDPSLPRY